MCRLYDGGVIWEQFYIFTFSRHKLDEVSGVKWKSFLLFVSLQTNLIEKFPSGLTAHKQLLKPKFYFVCSPTNFKLNKKNSHIQSVYPQHSKLYFVCLSSNFKLSPKKFLLVCLPTRNHWKYKNIFFVCLQTLKLKKVIIVFLYSVHPQTINEIKILFCFSIHKP